MLLPSVSTDTNDFFVAWTHWRRAIPAGMASVLVVTSLIVLKLVLQVRCGPEQGLIQQLSPNTANQSLCPQVIAFAVAWLG